MCDGQVRTVISERPLELFVVNEILSRLPIEEIQDGKIHPKPEPYPVSRSCCIAISALRMSIKNPRTTEASQESNGPTFR